MVYWGCGTPRNRLAWAWVVTMASLGAALFCMGAAKLDACKYLLVALQACSIETCSLPPKAMLIAGAALIVAALPPLLFFGGCSQRPAGAPLAAGKESDITVVRQGHNGVALCYKYDGDGRLIVAPDRFSEESVDKAAALRGSGGSWGRSSPKLSETYVPRQWDNSSCYVSAAPRGAARCAEQRVPAPAPGGSAQRLSQPGGGLTPLHAGRQASLARAQSDLYSINNP